jgi:predicted amidohydrolase
MIVDPMGEILYTKKEEEDTFTITLNKADLDAVRAKLPFWRDGDQFQILPG